MRPIAILCTSRTGSSLIAGIFSAHGLNCGTPGESLGYTTYESQEVKAVLRSIGEWHIAQRGGFRNGEEWISFDDGHTAALYDVVTQHEIGLIKCGLEYWRALAATWFELPVIKIRRDLDSAAQSVADKRGEDFETVREIVRKRFGQLDTIPGVTVNTDDVIAGDLTTLRGAFDYCGIDFCEFTARSVIEPDRWHYAA